VPEVTEGMDERYWREFRARVRRRASSQGALILCPFGIVIAILKILEPTYYPAGDIRNDMLFRLVFYGGAIAFLAVTIAVSVRWLIMDRRRPR
jgi:hypothetical protein